MPLEGVEGRLEGETLVVNGRKVRFVWKAELGDEYEEMVKKICVDVLENSDEELGILPNLEFVIEREPNREAWAGVSQVEKGSLPVYLNASIIEKHFSEEHPDYGEKVKTLEEKIRHEIVHLWDAYENSYAELRNRHLGRLEEIKRKYESEVEQICSEIRTGKAVALGEIRSYVTLFFYAIRSEGIAMNLDGKINRKYNSPEKAFERFESEARDSADKIKKEFKRMDREKFLSHLEKMMRAEDTDEVRSELELIKNTLWLGGNKHNIGKHVIYSIRYFDSSSTVKELAELDPKETIKLYEEMMLENGENPVVSINSGEGDLDYNRMVQKAARIFNEIVEIEKK